MILELVSRLKPNQQKNETVCFVFYCKATLKSFSSCFFSSPDFSLFWIKVTLCCTGTEAKLLVH